MFAKYYNVKVQDVKSYLGTLNIEERKRFLFESNDKDRKVLNLIRELYDYENKNCKTYSQRIVSEYFGEYFLEDFITRFIVSDRKLKDHFLINNETFDDDFEIRHHNLNENKFEIDLEVNNTNILIDAKTRLVKTQGDFNTYLEKKSFLKYSNIAIKEDKDVWLCVYYNYGNIIGLRFFRIRDLIPYIEITNQSIVPTNICNNRFENNKQNVFITSSQNGNEFINFNISTLGYTIDEFIDFCCK